MVAKRKRQPHAMVAIARSLSDGSIHYIHSDNMNKLLLKHDSLYIKFELPSKRNVIYLGNALWLQLVRVTYNTHKHTAARLHQCFKWCTLFGVFDNRFDLLSDRLRTREGTRRPIAMAKRKSAGG